MLQVPKTTLTQTHVTNDKNTGAVTLDRTHFTRYNDPGLDSCYKSKSKLQSAVTLDKTHVTSFLNIPDSDSFYK